MSDRLLSRQRVERVRATRVTRDEQEALSIRYAAGVCLVPLSSGTWAVFEASSGGGLGTSIDFVLVEGGWAAVEMVVRQVSEARQRERQQRRWQARQQGQQQGQQQGHRSQVLAGSLEELGL